MEKKENITVEAEEYFKGLKINIDPEVVLKDEVGQRIDDYWAGCVVSGMTHKWFRIRTDSNRIIIEPVNVEPIQPGVF